MDDMRDKVDSAMYQSGKSMVEGPNPNRYNHSYKYRNAQKRRERERAERTSEPERLPAEKPSFGQRFKDSFFAATAQEIWDYILRDIMIPSFKNLLNDVFTSSKDMLLWGDSRSTVSSGENRGKYASRSGSALAERRERRKSTSIYDYNKVRIPTRDQALDILDDLDEQIESNGDATVGYLFWLLDDAGVRTDHEASSNDESYGWSSLDGADARQVSDGWKLILPRLEVLDKRR